MHAPSVSSSQAAPRRPSGQSHTPSSALQLPCAVQPAGHRAAATEAASAPYASFVAFAPSAESPEQSDTTQQSRSVQHQLTRSTGSAAGRRIPRARLIAPARRRALPSHYAAALPTPPSSCKLTMRWHASAVKTRYEAISLGSADSACASVSLYRSIGLPKDKESSYPLPRTYIDGS